jgi:tetratricopeptide (TPR) repeat protein
MLTKCTRPFLAFLLFICLNFGALMPAWGAPDSVITVGASSGQLTVRRRGKGKPVELRSGHSLYIGDVISTGAESRASLIFPDGAQVRLNARAIVEVTPPRRQRGGKLSLFRVIAGQVWARLRPNNAVETRTAVLGVRGTEILVDVAADESTTLTVTDGAVDFYNEFGAVSVEQNQQSVARIGSAPSAPITIQNAGFIVEWTLDLDRAVIPREQFFTTLDRVAAGQQAQKLRAAAVAEPRNARARGALGDALFDSGQFNEAATEYNAALAVEPTNTAFTLRAGRALLEADRLEEAERQFVLALNGNMPLEPSQQQAVDALIQRGERTVPLPVTWSGKATAPAWGGLADIALTRDRPEIAEVLARQGIAADANLAAPRVSLGIALLRQPAKMDEAIQQLQAAIPVENGAAAYQARAWLSLAHLAQDDRAAALTEARQAVDLAPQSGLAHGQLALVYFYDGQSGLARQEAEQALRLNPDSVAARVALGQTALVRGDVDQANRIAAQAVALDPDLPQARYLLGVSDAGRRDYRHAVRELQTAINLAPNFLAARSALARVYNATGRSGEAATLLTDLLPHYKETDTVQGALGELYYEQGRYDESAASYRSALEKNPNSALYNAELARTLLYSNRLNEAIEAGRAAILLAPNVGQYHAILGQAYEFAILPTQAEREYRTALTLDPQNALALAELAFRHAGTDLRPAAAGFTQSFLLDPAIGRQLLRGGSNLEVTPVIGSRDQKDLDLVHRGTALDGKLHTFGALSSRNDDGFRPNSRNRDFDVSERVTFTPTPRTNVYANLAFSRYKDGLPGPQSSPVLDDNAKFRFGQAQLAVRQRIGSTHYLWTGLFANRSRNVTRDPNQDSFFDLGTGFPIPSQTFTSRAFEPEARLDLSLNNEPGRNSLLTLGAAQTRTRFRSDRELVMTPVMNGIGQFEQDADGYIVYTQLNHRFNPQLSLIGQLRIQRITRDTSSALIPPGGVPNTTTSATGRTYTLPSLLATYLFDKRTTMRLAYNERVTDVTTSTFAPTETLITTEPGTLPYGIPDSVRVAQIEVERNLSKRAFAKIFAFHSEADDLQIGFSDLLGFGNGLPAAQSPGLRLSGWKGTGVGLRYEHQLGRFLFANVGGVLRRTESSSSDSIGAEFDGGRAPYEPKFLANAALNYRDDHGRRAGIRLRHNGSFFQDSPLALGRSRFGAQTYVDLTLGKQFSVRSEIFFNVLNLFDRSQVEFRDFPIGQRQFSLGYTQRF